MAERTLGEFYLGCDPMHRELYSIMIHEWQETGHDWAWSDRGIALVRKSVVKDQTLNFFYLQPGQNIYPASITLDTDQWRELVGQQETDAFLNSLKAIHGLQYRQRENIFSIDDPGHLSGAIQQQLRDAIKRFGFRVPELVAS